MPELPEVQTVVTELKEKVCGRIITSVDVLRESIIQNDVSLFRSVLVNKCILDISRRGKYILFTLADNSWLLAHLRMTGKFIVQVQPARDHIHNRVLFTLDNQLVMIFNDLRCFGTLEIINSPDSNSKLKRLGWDPWDKHLTVKAFSEKLVQRAVPIKTLLLDQGVIAGLGNIYASEILFHAGINPKIIANRLTDVQMEQIIKSTRSILSQALKYNGTSISDFRRVDDKLGTFQNFLKVYGKEDQPCTICSTPIQKFKQSQRSTFHCPQCQR